MILAIGKRFLGRILLGFGWGTNLTNDLGFMALSLVAKAVESNGHETAKLSDNLAKVISVIERFVGLAKYKNTN